MNEFNKMVIISDESNFAVQKSDTLRKFEVNDICYSILPTLK